MPNIDLDQLKDWLILPDNELRDKLTEWLPYRPENIYLAPATHPEYGEVHVISTKPDHDGEVAVTFLAEESTTGADEEFVSLDSLTFTKPAEPAAPVKPAHPEWLETEEDYLTAPVGTICGKANDSILVISVIDYGRWGENGYVHRISDLAGTRRRVLRLGWGNDD